MAELVKDKEVAASAAASQSGGCGHDNVAAVSAEEETSRKKFHSRTFLDVKTEQGFDLFFFIFHVYAYYIYMLLCFV